jgi:murein L,D-transpeptidase YcbB/YkuD
VSSRKIETQLQIRLNLTFTLKGESGLQITQEIPVTLTRRNILRSLAALPLMGSARAFAQQTDSIAALVASTEIKLDFQGKLGTHTGVVADKRESAMVTAGSFDAMQNAIGLYEEAVAGGGWKKLPAGKFEKGVKAPRVVNLRERLVREGYLGMEALSVEAPEAYDGHLIGAVRAFQIGHGLAPSGKIDQRTRAEMDISARQRLFMLYENMPRIEAHISEIRERAILVNIPSLQLETVQNGIVYARHNIVVGKLDRPTPTLNSVVTDVTFNPYWNAPASIVAKDIIPKYLKDPEYLNQMDIRVFDGVGGPEIDPAYVDWANTPPERYHFQQQPGEHNALATVKVNFANKFMVYMHDTPHRELFAQNDRYQSSGCVRVDQVRMFINWILAGQDGFTEADFEMITAGQQNTVMPVNDPPSVHFMYLTAWATEDGRINFRPDPYQLDGKGFTLGQPEPVANI